MAWEAYGAITALAAAALRPWAYWKFELGEEQSENGEEAIRLAELGLLRDDEFAAIAEPLATAFLCQTRTVYRKFRPCSTQNARLLPQIARFRAVGLLLVVSRGSELLTSGPHPSWLAS